MENNIIECAKVLYKAVEAKSASIISQKDDDGKTLIETLLNESLSVAESQILLELIRMGNYILAVFRFIGISEEDIDAIRDAASADEKSIIGEENA